MHHDQMDDSPREGEKVGARNERKHDERPGLACHREDSKTVPYPIQMTKTAVKIMTVSLMAFGPAIGRKASARAIRHTMKTESITRAR